MLPVRENITRWLTPQAMGVDPRRAIEFVVLSFEGPDPYSLVGGLGVRVTEMTRALAGMGYRTRLVFVGDPEAPPVEVVDEDGLLILHRWGGWLAQRYPKDVYQGEMAKVGDYESSVPAFLLDSIIKPNADEGVTTVVLGEDWHTASTIVRTANLVREHGLLRRVMFLWNANNTFGFSQISWKSLNESAQILTVSRYMREKMRAQSVQPLVVPNGIPPRFWSEVDQATGRRLRALFPDLLLTKVGRYHPDKRWLMAVEAVGECKRLGLRPKLIVRGGSENYRQQIVDKAIQQGLDWRTVRPGSTRPNDVLKALRAERDGDILELDFFVPESFLRTLYWASHAVLANSGHEPFGLVGLEVMACGGVAITGSTGEEYLQSFYNGIALGSDDSREITVYLRELLDEPGLGESLRERGRETSQLFAWEVMLRDLLRKIEFVSWVRGIHLEVGG